MLRYYIALTITMTITMTIIFTITITVIIFFFTVTFTTSHLMSCAVILGDRMSGYNAMVCFTCHNFILLAGMDY